MDNKGCLAQYLFELIRDGKYKSCRLCGGEARITIKKNWWSDEEIWVQVWWRTSTFTYRNLEVSSLLATEALEILQARDKATNNIDYHNTLRTIVKDLRLKCK